MQEDHTPPAQPSPEGDTVERLALECLDRLPLEGEDVVERICEDYPELLDEVRRVLRQLSAAGLLAEPTSEAERTPGSVRLEPGARIGEFELVRPLGAGGMGVVWLARQERLQRSVALKVMHPGSYLGRRARARFRREVTVISQIVHPNICTVYEAGEAGGQPFLAMRYVEGASLAEHLARRRAASPPGADTPATPSRRVADDVERISKVARAAHVVHEAGFVHRDIKPGNILIDAAGEPVLVDFGLARDQDADGTALTLTGDVLGTPAYMAPEQVAGRAIIDRRADVYALGVVLYECLTLRTPFESTERAGLYHQILTEPPPNPRRYSTHIGSDLWAILERALEKDPARRFATAGELADDLDRVLRREPTRTRPPGVLGRTLRWCRRNVAATVIVAVTVTCLVLALGLLVSSRRASDRYLAQALISAARGEARSHPDFAFKLAREALTLDPTDPRILAGVQACLHELNQNRVVYDASSEVPSGSLNMVTVSFSPDGRFFATLGHHHCPTIHRASDGQRIGALEFPSLRQDVAFAWSPDGRIAYGGRTGFVDLYRVGDAGVTPLRALQDPGNNWYLGVAFGPGGEVLAGGHRAVLFTADGAALPLPGRSERSWKVAFLPDGRFVASGRLWKRTGREIQAIKSVDFDSLHIKWVLVARGPARIVTAAMDGPAEIRDFDGEIVTQIPSGQDDGVSQIALSHDERRLAISYKSGRVRILRTIDGGSVHDFAPRSPHKGFAVFSADDARVIVGDTNRLVRVHALDGELIRELRGHTQIVRGIAVQPGTPSGIDRIVSAGFDGTVRMWPAEAGAGAVGFHGLVHPRFAMIPGTGTLVVASADGRLLHLDRDGQVLREDSAKLSAPNVTIAPDGHTAVISSEDGVVFLWDVRAGTAPRAVRTVTDVLQSAHLLADGALLLRGRSQVFRFVPDPGREGGGRKDGASISALAVTATRDGRSAFAILGDLYSGLADGRPTRVPDASGGAPASVATSVEAFADGRRVVLGYIDGEVSLRDLETGRCRAFAGHGSKVQRLALSPDEARLASSATDGTVHVSDVASGALLMVLEPMGDTIREVGFVSNERIVTSGPTGSLRWWWLEPGPVHAEVDRVPIPHTWTERERRCYPHLLR